MGGWKDYLRMLLGWKAGQTAIPVVGSMKIIGERITQPRMADERITQPRMADERII